MDLPNKYQGLTYLGLDARGDEVERNVRTISDLHTVEERVVACREAALGIARALSLDAPDHLVFGVPVYQSFGMTHAEAKRSPHAPLLLTRGCDVPLTYCQ